MIQPERLVISPLTKEEQQQGLRALAALERLRNELASKYGKSAVESWELLDQPRGERTGDLMRSLEE